MRSPRSKQSEVEQEDERNQEQWTRRSGRRTPPSTGSATQMRVDRPIHLISSGIPKVSGRETTLHSNLLMISATPKGDSSCKAIGLRSPWEAVGPAYEVIGRFSVQLINGNARSEALGASDSQIIQQTWPQTLPTMNYIPRRTPVELLLPLRLF